MDRRRTTVYYNLSHYFDISNKWDIKLMGCFMKIDIRLFKRKRVGPKLCYIPRVNGTFEVLRNQDGRENVVPMK